MGNIPPYEQLSKALVDAEEEVSQPRRPSSQPGRKNVVFRDLITTTVSSSDALSSLSSASISNLVTAERNTDRNYMDRVFAKSLMQQHKTMGVSDRAGADEDNGHVASKALEKAAASSHVAVSDKHWNRIEHQCRHCIKSGLVSQQLILSLGETWYLVAKKTIRVHLP